MTARGCNVEGCDRPHVSKGYCGMHAERVRRYGAPILVGRGRKPTDPLTRFVAKYEVDPQSGCWNWTAHVSKRTGYGTFRTSAELRGPAHRRGWELLRGPLADDVVLDHLCRNRRCVNPDHLDPVDHQTNVDRGERKTKTHCPRGHAYDEANTVIDARGRRGCRTCRREQDRQYRKQRQAR